MISKKTPQKNENKNENALHDIRGHLSAILSASELAIFDEATITREDALAVIKTIPAEVDAIIHILEEMQR